MYTFLLLNLLPFVLAVPAPVSAADIVPRDGTPIPGKYIVRLKDAPGQFSTEAVDLLEKLPTHTYRFGDFHGFAAELSPGVIQTLQNHPNVAYIQPDTMIKLSIPNIRITSCHPSNPRCISKSSPSSASKVSSSSSTTRTSSQAASSTPRGSSSASTTLKPSSSNTYPSYNAPSPIVSSKTKTSSSSSAVKTPSPTPSPSSKPSSSPSSSLASKTSSLSNSPATSSSPRISPSSTSSSTYSYPSPSATSGNFMAEVNAPWDLARLSNKSPGQANYTYDSSAGSGVCVYVVDTGIDTSHPEFQGRATFLKNFVSYENATDLNGHGTHVAGSIGSLDFGVAKKTSLFAVKFLDANGSGSQSGVLSAFDFVVNDSKSRSCPNGVVLNLSAGGPQSDAINDAANQVVSNGIFFAAAAGNDNADAANDSPASASMVYTVGATDEYDAKASFSNYGSAVDIFGPGVDILSTYKNNQYAYMDGTSMATPHIAGLAAYILAFEGKTSPADLRARLTALAQKGLITGLPAGTINNLAFNGSPSAQ